MSKLAVDVLPSSSLVVKLAKTSTEIEQAFRLRYSVFVEEEQNQQLESQSGLEQDRFDPFCDHLIVKDLEMDAVVGTYRLLPGSRISKSDGFYSETEFNLSGFPSDKSRLLELGRSCIAPAYRTGRAIQLLWEGIAAYLADHQYPYLIGCASLRPANLTEVNEIYSLLKMKQILTDKFGVCPLETHRIPGLQMIQLDFDDRVLMRRLPPLMKGYQWLGAEIGGEPAYDLLFDTVDFFIVLETARVAKKYKRHFLTR